MQWLTIAIIFVSFTALGAVIAAIVTGLAGDDGDQPLLPCKMDKDLMRCIKQHDRRKEELEKWQSE